MDNDTNNTNGNIEFIESEENDSTALKNKIKNLRDDLKKCESERKDYLDGWQRAKADYVNYKKDEGKRFEETIRFIVTDFIKDLLPVLDSFDLALQNMFSDSEAGENKKGILLIRSQLTDIMKKRDIEEIKVAIGGKFDPGIHESLGEVESKQTEGTVAEEIQKGYRFKDYVIRPARVRLAKGKN